MRKTFATAAATTALVIGGSLACATSASAAPSPPSGSWDHTWYTSDSAHGGTIYVQEYGDIVYLCDSAADGYAPTAMIGVKDSTGAYQAQYLLSATGGNGSCASHRASQGGKYNLPENIEISIGVWLGGNLHGSTHYYLNDN